MRDKARIPRMINKINRIWKQQPDLRLGQIIEIAHGKSGSQADVFNVEDDILEEGIDLLLNELDRTLGT